MGHLGRHVGCLLLHGSCHDVAVPFLSVHDSCKAAPHPVHPSTVGTLTRAPLLLALRQGRPYRSCTLRWHYGVCLLSWRRPVLLQCKACRLPCSGRCLQASMLPSLIRLSPVGPAHGSPWSTASHARQPIMPRCVRLASACAVIADVTP